MKYSLLKIYFILFFIGTWFTAYTQQYCFQQFSLQEGLPQSEVTQIIQSPMASIWVGTNGGGLAEFDGKRFYAIKFSNRYVDKEILNLFKSQNNTIYIVGRQVLSVYNGISVVNYFSEQGYISAINTQIAENRSTGEIFILTINGNNKSKLKIVKKDSLELASKYYPELKGVNITHLFQDTLKRILYLNSPTRNFVLSNKVTEKKFRFKKFKNYKSYYPFARISDTLFIALTRPSGKYQILFKTNTGIYKFPQTHKSKINFYGGIHKDKDGALWLQTNNGVAFYKNDSLTEITQNNGLPVSNSLSLITDNEGNVWIGTAGGGLSRFCGNEVMRFTEKESLKSNIVRCFTETDDTTLWIGTEGGGISRLNYRTNRIRNYWSGRIPSANKIYGFAIFHKHLVAASAAGILTFMRGIFKNSNLRYGLSAKSPIRYIFADNDSLWFSPQNGGVYCYYKGKRTKYTSEEGLVSNYVSHIFKDKNNRIWLCSLSGVNFIEDGKVYGPNISPPENTLSFIGGATDIGGNVWLASYSQGIYRYNSVDNKLESVQNLSRWKDFLIYSIAIDKNDKLWLGGQHGIWRYKIVKGNKIISENQWTGNSKTLECNGSAVYLSHHNKIWFGTIQGAVGIKLKLAENKIVKPKIFISGLKLFLNTINWQSTGYRKYYKKLIPWRNIPKNPQFPFNYNHISFQIKAIDFSESEGLRYSWLLDGFDKKWSPLNNQSFISYSNLPPGDYTFKIKAVNRLGVWSNIDNYSFKIVEPIWKKAVFQSLILSLILLFITFLVVLRIRRLRRHKDDLEILVNMKTREIMQQNAEILTQNKILENQKSRITETIEKLKDSYSDLALLNEIGKDITSSLSHITIINKVYNNLNTLMDASIFGIGIYNTQLETIEFISAIEKGEVLPQLEVSVKEKTKLAVKCFNENIEIFISDFESEYKKYGKTPMQLVTQQIPSSLFYVPLIVGDNKIGIITVQSYRKNAYEEYHLNLVRNLSIYTSIALVNAATYTQLKEKTENLETANNFIKENNNQIEKQNQELKKLNDEKNKLIRIVAHDLRNPLTAGLTSLDILLQSEKSISNKGRRHFEFLRSSLWRMNEMISKILDVQAIEGRKSNLKVEKMQATELIENLMREYQKQAESKDVTVDFEKAESDYRIFADRSYLTQILDNLLSNAIKFAPYKSNIWIKEHLEEDTLLITVKDNGQGFKEEELKELFKNFRTFSARPTGNEKSSGIGLSVVKKYIDQMDAKVWCESEYGKGANFIIEFDLV